MFDGQLEILGVPCNQFNGQEPGWTSQETLNAIKYVRPGGGFEPNFPLFEKAEVNGENKHPLYAWVEAACPPANPDFNDPGRLFYTPLSGHDIRWNWEKVLIDKSGQPYRRYLSSVTPMEIADDIEMMLNS